MPESQQPLAGQQSMVADILASHPQSVADIGAGTGKWGRILKGQVARITAIEIWASYVEQYHLREVYDEVIIGDVRHLSDWSTYDLAILGDVLEHLQRQDALALVDRLSAAGLAVYLTVPITPCAQEGEVYNNPYESHLDQWTHEELTARGWQLIHRGLNPRGTVEIGTYKLGRAN